MVKPVRKSSSKNPPILSHEFIIQNHADIVSCVAMVFVIGIMIQATSPFASIFIALQHNVTEFAAGEVPLYQPGMKDWCAVFFYSLICIVIHAILQEYVLDKISKRLHLSKSKLAVFSTSGQLAAFYLVSTVWGLDIIVREHYLPDLSLLWLDYPAALSFMLKLFMIVQLAYSLHELPEIYFQRTKREEYVNKAFKSIAALVLIAVPYFLNFNRLLVCLIVLHYMSDLVYHVAQLVQTMDREEKLSKNSIYFAVFSVCTLVSNVVLVLARLASIIVSVLTLWYGLALENKEQIDLVQGNFNTAPVRLVLLGGVCALQAYLMFNFITQLLAKVRENKAAPVVVRGPKPKKDKSKKVVKKVEKEESDLPEVDQNTNKNLRSRAQKTK
ncbi:TRAM [Carabus blaptoides fortunei]